MIPSSIGTTVPVQRSAQHGAMCIKPFEVQAFRKYRHACLKVEQLKLPQVAGTDSEELAVQLLIAGFPGGGHWQQLFAKTVVVHDSAGYGDAQDASYHHMSPVD